MVILRLEHPRPVATKSRVGARGRQHAASLLPSLAGQTLSAGLRDYLLPTKDVRKDGGNVHLRSKTLAEEGTAANILAVS